MKRNRSRSAAAVVALVLATIAAVFAAGPVTGATEHFFRPSPAATRVILKRTRLHLQPSATRRTVLAARGSAESNLLDAVAGGLGSPAVVSAEIGAPPAGFAQDPRLNEVGTTWLYLEMAAPTSPEGQVMPEWEALLLAGAYRDRAHQLQLPDLLGFSLRLRFPDGTESGSESTVISQPFAHNVKTSRADVEAALSTRLAKLPTVGKEDVTFREPDQPAPVVTLTSSDPALLMDAVRGPGVALRALGPLSQYEGSFVEVQNSAGTVERVAAFSTRTGIGIGWSKPGLPSDTGTLGHPAGLAPASRP